MGLLNIGAVVGISGMAGQDLDILSRGGAPRLDPRCNREYRLRLMIIDSGRFGQRARAELGVA